MVLADEQRAALEPLVEACRPRAKTPPCHLRRTVEAIIWRHKDGTTWRSIPGGLDLGGWQRSCPSTGPGSASGGVVTLTAAGRARGRACGFASPHAVTWAHVTSNQIPRAAAR